MSGNAFKDYEITLSSHSHFLNVRSVLRQWFFDPFLSAAGSTQFFELDDGNTVKPKNDLDFVVQASKEEVIKIITDNPYIETYRKFGNTISTLWKTEDGFIHVDLMPSVNVNDESWIMTGGSQDIKGVVRNVLLCYLARLFSESETERLGEETKWTIAFPGGMGLKQNGICLNRNTSPRFILDKLGLPNNDKQIETSRTFEGLSALVEWDTAKLERFEDYAKEQWLYKKSPDVFEKAFDYLRATQNQV